MDFSIEGFLSYFGERWGFEILGSTDHKIMASTKGSKYWIVLEIDTNHFHVKLEHDLISQQVFFWQNAHSYDEIGQLMLLNAVLRTELVHAARKRPKTLSSKVGQQV